MPRVLYTDDQPSAPVGYALFSPGEQRDVTTAQAAELTRNPHFRLVAPPAAVSPAPVAAPAPPEPPGSAPTSDPPEAPVAETSQGG